MSRPKRQRMIDKPPLYAGFKPIGITGSELTTLEMSLDEYEAMRLADFQGLSQEDAAGEMEISRPTFSRLIEEARNKCARFFIEGRKLVIKGGPVHFRENLIRCHDCGRLFTLGLDDEIMTCPSCESENLIDLAGGFGHGQCCRDENA